MGTELVSLSLLNSIYGKLRTGNYYTSTLRSRRAVAIYDDYPANILWAHPIVLPRPITIDRIGINVAAAGAAGAAARIGIYNDGTNVYPGTLLLDAGAVACTGTGDKVITISQSLQAGIYWLAMVSNDATIDFSYIGDQFQSILGGAGLDSDYGGGWEVAQAYGALPDPFTAGGTMRTYLGAVQVRVLSLD